MSTVRRLSAGLVPMALFARTRTSTGRIGQTVAVTGTPLRTAKAVFDISETRSETNRDRNALSGLWWTTGHNAAHN